MHKVSDPELKFPPFVLCPSPGYRTEALRRLGIKEEFWQLSGR